MQHTIAVDLAKSVFQVAESHQPGKVSRTRRLSRSQFERYLAQQAPSRFLFEACGSAHHWGRKLVAAGHEVRLLPPHHVRHYRAGDKTDQTDAKALLEADRNEAILSVPVKSVDQQCLASLHRLRAGYVDTRRARINAIRGLLREYGVTIPVGARQVIPVVMALEPETAPEPLRRALMEVVEEVRELERRIAGIEIELRALVEQTPVAQHLLTIPGIGLITATALVGRVGDFRRFRSARHLSGYLGLVPKEHSSGSKRWLGPISKRGDTYLRTLLVHGARVVIAWAGRKTTRTPLEEWMLQVERRRGRNIAIVALANKLARFAWVVATQQRDFRPAA